VDLVGFSGDLRRGKIALWIFSWRAGWGGVVRRWVRCLGGFVVPGTGCEDGTCCSGRSRYGDARALSCWWSNL